MTRERRQVFEKLVNLSNELTHHCNSDHCKPEYRRNSRARKGLLKRIKDRLKKNEL